MSFSSMGNNSLKPFNRARYAVEVRVSTAVCRVRSWAIRSRRLWFPPLRRVRAGMGPAFCAGAGESQRLGCPTVDSGLGVLRLRGTTRFANRPASLRMTEWGNRRSFPFGKLRVRMRVLFDTDSQSTQLFPGLFVAEGYHGVDFHGGAGWDVAGQEACRQQG
jgi:hypothetical protein